MTGPATVALSKTVVVDIDVDDVLRSVTDEQLMGELQRRRVAPEDAEAALTGEAIRGARGLLGWTLNRLSDEAGVSVSTIKRMEDASAGTARPVNADAVRGALRNGGAEIRSLAGATCIVRAPRHRQVHDSEMGGQL